MMTMEEESDEDMYGEIRDEEGQDEGEEARVDHTLRAENVIFVKHFFITLFDVCICYIL